MIADQQDDDLTPRIKDAGDAALELMKQLIALSSGVLALSAAFLEKFHIDNICEYSLLALSWLLMICALVAALDAISAIVKSYLTPEKKWYEGRGKKSASVSKWAFVLGIFVFALLAIVTNHPTEKQTEKPNTGIVIDTAALRKTR